MRSSYVPMTSEKTCAYRPRIAATILRLSFVSSSPSSALLPRAAMQVEFSALNARRCYVAACTELQTSVRPWAHSSRDVGSTISMNQDNHEIQQLV